MLYQFRIDGRAAGPVRYEWIEAARDAVNDGYAQWADKKHTTVILYACEGAELVRLKEEDSE